MNSTKDSDSTPNLKVESSFEAACSGSREAAALFFEGLISGPLYVPDRHQKQPMSDQPSYPNDLVYMLGLRDVNRVIVPAFTRPEFIEEWCGQPLSYKKYSGDRLYSAIPADWWIVINPGTDIEKDLSPWEIERLKGGNDFVSELVEELFSEEETETLGVVLPDEDQLLDLKAELTAWAGEVTVIEKLFLLKEERRENQGLDRLLLGVQLSPEATDRAAEYKEEISRITGLHQIGSDPVSIYIGSDLDTGLTLGFFKDFPPFYSRKVTH